MFFAGTCSANESRNYFACRAAAAKVDYINSVSVIMGSSFAHQKRGYKYDANDRRVADYILTCALNGCCSATCTTGSFTQFSCGKYRSLSGVEKMKRQGNHLKCMLCGKCIFVCPRGVIRAMLFITKLLKIPQRCSLILLYHSI